MDSRISELTYERDASYFVPFHEVRDSAKLEGLVASMKGNGWEGAPVVVVNDDQLMTGSHRHAAAMEAGVKVPAVDIEALIDLFDISDEEFEEDKEDFAFISHLCRCNNPELADYLGMDAH